MQQEGRVQQHTAEHSVDVSPFVQILDAPVPLKVEQLVGVLQFVDALVPVAKQVIEVPRMFWPLEQGSAEVIEVGDTCGGGGGLGGGLAAVAGSRRWWRPQGAELLKGGARHAASSWSVLVPTVQTVQKTVEILEELSWWLTVEVPQINSGLFSLHLQHLSDSSSRS